jgi:alpha-galactosidase
MVLPMPYRLLLAAVLLLTLKVAGAGPALAYYEWAPTPPMGWNSWDCFATTVTEAQAKANAGVMAEKLKPYGWRYIVVDIQWYEPAATGFNYRRGARLAMDGWGRLLPATNRFPSAANGAGFKPLADYVHSLGLKFGIHLLRGIPRQAVRENTPIFGTRYLARDIADTQDVCRWNTDMYGVDMSRPGAQEYYNSVFDLLASWDVDFVKVDDLSRPYHKAEIAAIRRAIDQSGRPIVFSTSPGATPLAEGANIEREANMWRISDDFWDQWRLLFEQFKRLDDWTPYRGMGHYPDADMLPLGAIRQVGDSGGHTRFTADEQITMMSLWAIARSPLIMGGDLTKLDGFTLSLLTDPEVIAVDQHSSNNRQIFDRNGLIGWMADAPRSGDKYLALFNTTEGRGKVPVDVLGLGLGKAVRIRDLWKQSDIAGVVMGRFAPEIPAHGAGLYRIMPVK